MIVLNIILIWVAVDFAIVWAISRVRRNTKHKGEA